jgi:hypothetical protein
VYDGAVEMMARAARLPVVIGFTVLGAGVVICRRLLGIATSLMGAGEPPARHHTGRVREQAGAAARAARAAGVLSPRR